MVIIARRPLLAGFGSLLAAGCSGGEPYGNIPGAYPPDFKLQDFQPKSARFGETYGLDEFRGSVLFMPLFAGWCSTCIGCATILDDVYKEWQAEGLNMRVCAINPSNAKPQQRLLTNVCDFPLLQDTDEQQAWERLGGTKDDHYIYEPDGRLSSFIDFREDFSQMIVSEAGRAMFRQAIIDAGG